MDIYFAAHLPFLPRTPIGCLISLLLFRHQCKLKSQTKSQAPVFKTKMPSTSLFILTKLAEAVQSLFLSSCFRKAKWAHCLL